MRPRPTDVLPKVLSRNAVQLTVQKKLVSTCGNCCRPLDAGRFDDRGRCESRPFDWKGSVKLRGLVHDVILRSSSSFTAHTRTKNFFRRPSESGNESTLTESRVFVVLRDLIVSFHSRTLLLRTKKNFRVWEVEVIDFLVGWCFRYLAKDLSREGHSERRNICENCPIGLLPINKHVTENVIEVEFF